MNKTRPDQATSPSNLPDMLARRFPLVPRTKPACRALETRVARVRALANLANQRTNESLLRAAEAHNLAALIMSDCGMPALAQNLCRQQLEVFLTAQPLDTATAKLALQPLINLGRLLIRDGDVEGAYHLLTTLYEAITSRTDTTIDGRKLRFADLLDSADDHREVVQWMWTVLLADGTRALTQAGRWTEALHHATQHNGIGQRLFDGRQVAILTHHAAHDYDAALTMLTDTATPTPWEQAVAACLEVLCLTSADRPYDLETTTMMDRYLTLEPNREHAVFRARLGLCIIDLAAGAHGIPLVAGIVMREALDTADAYVARDILTHELCLAQSTIDASPRLTDTSVRPG